MKAILYLLGSLALVGAAVTMALLPHLSPSLWAFMLGGTLLSLLMAGGWLILSASAGAWPRVHSGPVLVAASLLGLAFALRDTDWREFGWGCLMLLAGIPLSLAWLRSRRLGPASGRRQQSRTGLKA